MPIPSDSELTALLNEEGSAIADDGFTARVIAALPPRRERAGWQTITVAGSLALAAAFALPALMPGLVRALNTLMPALPRASVIDLAVLLGAAAYVFGRGRLELWDD
jgi:hypothetical protein